MNKILLFSYLLLITKTSFAQYCPAAILDTAIIHRLPWYGNPEYLTELLDSMKFNKNSTLNDPKARGGNTLSIRYIVPVQVWIYQNDDGTNGISEQTARLIINGVNQVFEDERTRIQFAINCTINYVRNTNINNNISSELDPNFIQMFAQNNKYGSFDIHFVRNNNSNWAGIASFPSDPFTNFTCAVITNRNTNSIINTLVHELGHTLGLQHTR